MSEQEKPEELDIEFEETAPTKSDPVDVVDEEQSEEEKRADDAYFRSGTMYPGQ